ncbi:uroporphyrinogen-III synthase [Magnetospira sp. QH-2]|uniref:uroporphyrinogen-III synthase n=1 Tax=Magnetospira sp. (strain QH-2) TaxID=1288970 RepID=UPI0003E819F7|nr:uroporphyrinogen-III synthase [Magnetospira sp. QH-2]CCQ75375.1 putative uroporphyrinogen-III synthase [Magnetospira sp. QH-2]
MRLMITRPLDDARPLAELLESRGHQTILEPLLTVAPLAGAPLDLNRVQALLVTSANGVRAFAQVNPQRDLSVLAVGDASARAAREAGFSKVASASGDVNTLAELVRSSLSPAEGTLLHVAGSKVAGDLAGMLAGDGFAYRRAVLYTTRKARDLSETAISALKQGEVDGVVFFSPRTAATFVSLATADGVGDRLTEVTAFCLSQAVVDKARAAHWKDLRVAAHPDQASMIACIETEEAERES